MLLASLAMEPAWRMVHRARLPEGWLLVRPPHEVSCLLRDGGVLWAGGNDGLFRLDASSGARRFEAESEPPVRQVRALVRERDGTLWAAHGAGLEVRRGGRWSRVAGAEGVWWSLLAAHDGGVWAGGESGVARAREGRVEMLWTCAALGLGPITLLAPALEGDLWAASNSPIAGGVVRLRPDGTFEAPAWLGRLPHPSVNAIWTDADGTLWLGTGFGRRGGLFRLRGGETSVWTKQDGLAGEMVRSVWRDRAGRLWVGSEYDGIVYESNGGWRRLTPKDGLAGWEVKAMVEDGAGGLWLGTERGLTRLPLPEDEQ